MAKQTFTASQVLTAAQMNTLQANDFNQTVSTKTASYTLVAADVGTKIVMNAGATITTITVNTGLFAAGDTLEILNTSTSGICTITAGTATVSTSSTLRLGLNAGGKLYFTSAGVSVFQGDGQGKYVDFSASQTFGSFTVGNGSVDTKFCRIGDFIHFTGMVTLGSTSAITGALDIYLPQLAAEGLFYHVPTGYFFDSSANFFTPIFGLGIGTDSVRLVAMLTNGTYATNADTSATSPFTWATSDRFTWDILYKAAL